MKTFKTHLEEATELDEKLDHKELKSDLDHYDAKVHKVSATHKAEADVIGHHSFDTEKGKVPVLKRFDRGKYKKKTVTIKKGQKLVHDGDSDYYGYSKKHGHFRVANYNMNKDHLKESYEEFELDEARAPIKYRTFAMSCERVGKRLAQLGTDIKRAGTDLSKSDVTGEMDSIAKEVNELVKYAKTLPELAGKPAMAKEAYEDNEPASPDEGSMAMTQLEFIEYAAEEMMDHIKAGKAFPEWMQNKLTKAHTTIEGLHSSLGEHGGDDEDDEDDMKESTELDELSKKTLGSYYKAANKDLQKRGSSLRKTDDSTNKFRSRLKYAAKAKYKSDRMDEESTELDEASNLRITKVYNKFPKKATYAVHSLDRKYYKEFDSMDAAKAHHAEKSGK